MGSHTLEMPLDPSLLPPSPWGWVPPRKGRNTEGQTDAGCGAGGARAGAKGLGPPVSHTQPLGSLQCQ
jgi:hypothetical protein